MTQTRHWTSADLEQFPDDGKRREIIAGELFVSKQPTDTHQYAAEELHLALGNWSHQTGAGRASMVPGLVFADDDDVVPDLVWMSYARRREALGTDGHFHLAPELAVEVLSPGSTNVRRDRQVKLELYDRRGVTEYWIVDTQQRRVEVYRRLAGPLALTVTLGEKDTLESPLLPGFSCRVGDIFPPRSQ
jgi:Uma2 family endonuclease